MEAGDIEAERPLEIESMEEEEEEEAHHDQPQPQPIEIAKMKKPACLRDLLRNDSFLENGLGDDQVHGSRAAYWKATLMLAFQSIGVVYGDLGTSPLYVLPGVFPDGVINHDDEILGVLSLIFYAITLVSVIKYVFIVLAANDNGNGGTFALYSLLCRYADLNAMPNRQPEDREVSNYELELPSRGLKMASIVKSTIEKSTFMKYFILLVTLFATSMVMGDGILTPCISVLSAVSGIREATPALTDKAITWISVVILILLFQIQRFGTDKIGYSFAPILTIWFTFIGFIGIYNFVNYEPAKIIKAVNPWYILNYFATNKFNAWKSLGGVILCLTGSEALFADLGHFNVRAIRISACTIVFPSVICAYFGQASYLMQNKKDVGNAFYSSVPKKLYWPMFVIAVMAAVVASQSMISATFSIVQQSVALGCFPRVKIVHTSRKYAGQVYVPEINHLLMIACVGITIGFKSSLEIGNAYGIAVAFVLSITSSFLILVMIMKWNTNRIIVTVHALTIGLYELLMLSASLYKFVDGGYIPLIFAVVLVIIMCIWNYGDREKYQYQLAHKISIHELTQIASSPTIYRVPGIALFYTQLVHGISPLFTRYASQIKTLHSVLVFISIKSLHISKVPPNERFLFQRLESEGIPIFRCVVRYGYKDERRELWESFEVAFVDQLREFILANARLMRSYDSDGRELTVIDVERTQNELRLVDSALEHGDVTYLMGEGEMRASKNSSLWKKMMIDYGYNWLSRCVRQPDEVFMLPRQRLLKVGLTYEVQ
ncbi:potassium transporter 19-like [Tripterygium wilfordii]|uniref:Potassium transporter n=1 Tax=Tripterygium wilfordii TaxID=458696 RepID=A0A7J7E0L6_TRIWF|nr:potassium transporter 5-like [Tripterygium wilfordii]KAF5752190.1 potassium transporter 19-like [Tripterygium wilfordii]